MALKIDKTRGLMVAAVALALAVGFVFGLVLTGGESPESPAHSSASESAPATVTWWTCSMHPEIRQQEPGSCPKCGMDLIPAKSGGLALGERELELTPAARKLAQVQVLPVERRIVERQVRMVGTVTYDETRLATITAWVGGRLDRLYVDYTGIPVKPGDHMVWMYSPDVLAAQEELIQAGKAAVKMQEGASPLILGSVRATLEASRDKLRLWGLTPEQIAAIEERGTASDHIQINAPIGGIVIQKNAVEGDYVKTGMPIYRIADLTQVWVKLDAYESDLAWLRYGQEVTFHTEAYPGQTFSGRVAFIDPVLTEKTRTVKVRVNVPNTDGRLKPGMFVRAVGKAKVATGGKVIDEALAGKWIGPMHPEIVRDEPGDCPICGMPLQKAEELGYVSATDATAEIPLVIPASAPLITGKRAIVYVQDATDPSRFRGQEVVLGPRAGDWYLVESGLKEGEKVVVQGNFKIDSALQLQAKPSMMSADSNEPPVAKVETIAVPVAFTAQFDAVVEAYFAIQKALSEDAQAPAVAAAKQLLERLDAVDMGLLEGDPHMAWMKALKELRQTATAVAEGADIAASRAGFIQLSESLASAIRRFGGGLTRRVVVAHCPMAFDDRGANWLQAADEIANPYFGDAMYGCGEVTEVLVEEALEEDGK